MLVYSNMTRFYNICYEERYFQCVCYWSYILPKEKFSHIHSKQYNYYILPSDGKLDYKLISDVKVMIWNIVFSLVNNFKNFIHCISFLSNVEGRICTSLYTNSKWLN